MSELSVEDGLASVSLGNYASVYDSLSFNAFAEDITRSRSPDPSIEPQLIQPRPALGSQELASDSASASSTGSDSEISVHSNYKRHSRSQTEVNTRSTRTTRRGSSGHHPLRNPGLGMGSNDVGITRPHLTKMVGALVDAPPVREDMSEVAEVSEPRPEEKVVLVHEISSSDSLAGVSLKYGINMTELRHANHLWSTDSIHLRKVLYIPIDKASRALEFTGKSSCTDAAESSFVEKKVHPSLSGNRSGTHASLHPTLPASTIRRIPVSELSFFPPPSKPIALLPSRPPGSTPLIVPNPTNPYPTYSKYTQHTTSSTPSLSSILTALPIAASTRDTIIARLSFDSASSSYSDRERDVDGEGHELEDVRAKDSGPETPKARRRSSSKGRGKKSASQSPTHSRTTKSFSKPNGLPYHDHADSIPIRLEPPTSVRTVQLEPSPIMQLPFRSGLSNPKTRGKLKDVDLDLDDWGTSVAAGEIER